MWSASASESSGVSRPTSRRTRPRLSSRHPLDRQLGEQRSQPEGVHSVDRRGPQGVGSAPRWTRARFPRRLFVAALIGGGVVAVLVSFVLKLLADRRFTQQTEEIKGELERQALVYRSNRVWKERSLEERLEAGLHAARPFEPCVRALA